MRYFAAYHNAERMGRDYKPSGEYAFFSRKALTFLEQTVGATIWVINGARSETRTTNYTLCTVYIPDEVVDADDLEFDYIVAGSVGYDFDPPIILNHLAHVTNLCMLKSRNDFSNNRFTRGPGKPGVGGEILSPHRPEMPWLRCTDSAGARVSQAQAGLCRLPLPTMPEHL